MLCIAFGNPNALLTINGPKKGNNVDVSRMSDEELELAYDEADTDYANATTVSEENAIGIRLRRIESEMDARETARIEEWDADPS